MARLINTTGSVNVRTAEIISFAFFGVFVVAALVVRLPRASRTVPEVDPSLCLWWGIGRESTT